jgi:hypothetical protein
MYTQGAYVFAQETGAKGGWQLFQLDGVSTEVDFDEALPPDAASLVFLNEAPGKASRGFLRPRSVSLASGRLVQGHVYLNPAWEAGRRAALARKNGAGVWVRYEVDGKTVFQTSDQYSLTPNYGDFYKGLMYFYQNDKTPTGTKVKLAINDWLRQTRPGESPQ